MKYERLTAKDRYWENEELWTVAQELTFEEIDEIYNRLAELEDKIENGTLVELPCKVGAKIYIVGESDFCIPKYQMWEDEFCLEDVERFGDTVFLTKAEAEKRLEELRGEK